MAVVSVVYRSSLGNKGRIDPEYYKPEYLHLHSILTKKKCYKLSALSEEIKCGPFGSTLLCETYIPEGIPVIRPFNIKNFKVDSEEIVYISKEDVNTKGLKYYSNGDLLFSRVGDIRCGVIDGFHGNVTISPNIIAVKLKKRLINPYYVCVFMNTIYGYMQLERALKIVAQPTIETETVKELLIPVLDENLQQKTELELKSAFLQLHTSQSLYLQAENLLLEELGLKDFKPKYELSYTANLSQAFNVHRIDAEYFQPAYDEVVNNIMEYSNGYTRLLDCVENINPNFDPTKYPDKNFSYVELADIDASIGIIHSATEIKGEEAPSRARRILRENDVIVSSVEGSLEKVALVDKEYEGSLASTGFFQFRAANILPEVLLVLSKSIVLQAQLKRECSGTILTAVANESLKRILIPIISQETQQKIASLVQQSHSARRKAKELLEEAKRKVEEAIENEIRK